MTLTCMAMATVYGHSVAPSFSILFSFSLRYSMVIRGMLLGGKGSTGLVLLVDWRTALWTSSLEELDFLMGSGCVMELSVGLLEEGRGLVLTIWLLDTDRKVPEGDKPVFAEEFCPPMLSNRL